MGKTTIENVVKAKLMEKDKETLVELYLQKCFDMETELSIKNKQLADSEAQNKRVLEKLELLVRSNQELGNALELACEDINSLYKENKLKARTKLVLTVEPFGFMSLIDHFKKQAKEIIKSE